MVLIGESVPRCGVPLVSFGSIGCAMDGVESGACAADFAGHTRHLFVEIAQAGDIAGGQRPARRAVFRKTHGVAHGRLVLDERRPQALREGVFAGDSYDVWIRFSSDVSPTSSDADNGTLGIGIKLFGVAGPTLAEIDPDSPTGDLVLQNHDVFFVDSGLDMCVFTDLALKGRIQDWFDSHPQTEQILAEMAKREASVLSATYWSVLPYACGEAHAVKYRLRGTSGGPSRASDNQPNRLRIDLVDRLAAAAASFEFAIQVPAAGTNPPIDRATERWSETVASFIGVGRLDIPRQDVTVEGQEAYGETLTFNPWRTPAANRPLGTIAASRRLAYPASAAKRHYVNGVADAEPHTPRKP